MQLVSYFFLLVAYYSISSQCGLVDAVHGYAKPLETLTMKDVQRYVMGTSNVLEELAKEHLWLLSKMTGTNNWKDLLGEGHPASKNGRVTGESLARGEGDGEPQNRGEVEEHREKDVIAKNESPQPGEVQSMAEVEGSSQALNEVLVNQDVDDVASDKMQRLLQQLLDTPIIEDTLQPIHSHPQNEHSSGEEHPQSKSLKPTLNPKVGYTTDIGDGNQPDPKLNYLALKDKPIQHHVDPYGKPIKESDKLQEGSEVSNPLDSVSPRVLNTRSRDVVFSPLSANKTAVRPVGKPVPNKTPTPAAVSVKTTKSPNPLARLYNTKQDKSETNTLPKGIYNPLALDSYLADLFNDINNVVDTNSHSTINRLQSDEPYKDPLDFPVQYYKPESLPNTHSKPHPHPAYHSRLEDNDIGW